MNTKIMRVGLDLAKSGFVVYGVDGLRRLKQEWLPMRQRYAGRVPGMAWEEFDTLYRRLRELAD